MCICVPTLNACAYAGLDTVVALQQEKKNNKDKGKTTSAKRKEKGGREADEASLLKSMNTDLVRHAVQ